MKQSRLPVQKVLDAMIHFTHQKVLLFLSAALLGDIPGNFGCSDDFASCIPDR